MGVLNGALYCVGGPENKTVEKYSEDTNTWSQVAEMFRSHYFPGVIPHKGRLYVLGGGDGRSSTPQSSVEIYDPLENTWTLMTDMSEGRIGPAMALFMEPWTN